MAEQKLQVNVDFTNYPELYDALEKLVAERDTDRSKLIRQLVRQEVTKQDQSPTITRRSKKNARLPETVAV